MMNTQACDIFQKAYPAHSPAEWRKRKHLSSYCPWIDAKMLRARSILYEASFGFSVALYIFPFGRGHLNQYTHSTNLIRHTKNTFGHLRLFKKIESDVNMSETIYVCFKRTDEEYFQSKHNDLQFQTWLTFRSDVRWHVNLTPGKWAVFKDIIIDESLTDWITHWLMSSSNLINKSLHTAPI